MKELKISVITPVFNNERDIANCIDSIFGQTYKNIEHIIIDGNSSDYTLNIIKEKAVQNANIKFISEPDNGIYDAMNKGIRMATGDYLIFLGSDDIFYEKNTLEKIIPIFKDNDLIYGNVFFRTQQIIYGFEANLNKLKYKNIPHQGIFYKKNIFEKIGLYGTHFIVSEDYILNIKCFKNNSIKRRYTNQIITNFNDTSLSNNFRDGFQKYRLFHFDNLTLKEKLMKYYFYLRPDWFIPSKFFK